MGNHCRDEAENEGKFLDSVNQGKMGNPCRDEARSNGKWLNSEPEDNAKLKGMKERDGGNPLDDIKQEMMETNRGDEEGNGDSGCCEETGLWTEKAT